MKTNCCKSSHVVVLISLLIVYYTSIYGIGLHAVQFGNNWMRKIPRKAKLDEAAGQVLFGCQRNFFIQLFPTKFRSRYFQVFLFVTSRRHLSLGAFFKTSFCSRYDFSAVQVPLLVAQETF